MKLPLALLAKELSVHLSPGRIDKAFKSLPHYSPAKAPYVTGKVTVCALQVEAKVYASLEDMVKDIDRYMLLAAKSGAQIVCFPELFGLFIAFASPLARTVFKTLTKKSGSGDDSGHGDINIAELYKPFAYLPERYVDIMGRFSRRYGLWISCGTIFAYEGGKVFNRHIFLNDMGIIAGLQDKLHPVPEEAAVGVGRGNSLTVAETPFGKIALTVCMDATYFETFKIAKGLGADFAIVPIANAEPYNYHLALRGAASRVSETALAAVKPALVAGRSFPLEITGRAGIYFPMGFKQPSRETGQRERPEAITETLDIAALREYVPEGFCLSNREFNKNLMQAYKS